MAVSSLASVLLILWVATGVPKKTFLDAVFPLITGTLLLICFSAVLVGVLFARLSAKRYAPDWHHDEPAPYSAIEQQTMRRTIRGKAAASQKIDEASSREILERVAQLPGIGSYKDVERTHLIGSFSPEPVSEKPPSEEPASEAPANAEPVSAEPLNEKPADEATVTEEPAVAETVAAAEPAEPARPVAETVTGSVKGTSEEAEAELEEERRS